MSRYYVYPDGTRIHEDDWDSIEFRFLGDDFFIDEGSEPDVDESMTYFQKMSSIREWSGKDYNKPAAFKGLRTDTLMPKSFYLKTTMAEADAKYKLLEKGHIGTSSLPSKKEQ